MSVAYQLDPDDEVAETQREPVAGDDDPQPPAPTGEDPIVPGPWSDPDAQADADRFHKNLAQLRANIDAELDRGKLEQQLGTSLRPLIEKALGKPPAKLPTAIRVAWNDNVYYTSEHLSGGVEHDRPRTDEQRWAAIVNDVAIGILGGLVTAGVDYIEFERASLEGNVAEYRPHQVATQTHVGALVSDAGGTGAALAYAAFQWCFTNDLLFYAYAYLDDNQTPGWNDTRSGVEGLVSGNSKGISWASWSLLGLLTGKGTEARPMTFTEALVQGVVLGPWLAFALATLVESLDLQNLAGSLVSVSVDTNLDQRVDRADVVQALCVRLKLTPDQAMQLIARVQPLAGEISGTRVTGTLQMSDELVTAFIGCGIDFQQVGKDDRGKTIGHGQTASMITGFDYRGKNVSVSVSAKIPVDQKWQDNEKHPLDPQRREELHVNDDKYRHDLETLQLRLETGPFDLDAEVRASVRLREMFVGLGFTYDAGRLTFGGQAWLLTGVRRHPSTGFKLQLGVRF